MARKRCALLALPAELRLEIYAIVLPCPKKVGIYWMSSPGCLNYEDRDKAKTNFRALPASPPRRPKRRIAIIGTCRQIYYEARPLLYQPDELTLHLQNLDAGINQDRGERHGLPLHYDARNLRSLPSLEKFEVDITTAHLAYPSSSTYFHDILRVKFPYSLYLPQD